MTFMPCMFDPDVADDPEDREELRSSTDRDLGGISAIC
jgi:hypothetical protein